MLSGFADWAAAKLKEKKKGNAKKRIIDFILHYYILSDFVGCYAGWKHYVAPWGRVFCEADFISGPWPQTTFLIAAPADIFWSAVARWVDCDGWDWYGGGGLYRLKTSWKTSDLLIALSNTKMFGSSKPKIDLHRNGSLSCRGSIGGCWRSGTVVVIVGKNLHWPELSFSTRHPDGYFFWYFTDKSNTNRVFSEAI